MTDIWTRRIGQLRLLCWKNCTVQKRRLTNLVYVFVFPILLTGIMVATYLSLSLDKRKICVDQPTVFQNFSLGELSQQDVMTANRSRLSYSPDTVLTRRIMRRVSHLLGNVTIKESGVSSEAMIERDAASSDKYLGGIVFLFDDDNVLPKKISYKIRLRSEERYGWLTDAMYTSEPSLGPRMGNDSYGGYRPGYYRKGFLHLQRAVDLSIIQEINKDFDVNSVELQLKRFPYPEYCREDFFTRLISLMPLFLLLSVFAISNFICSEVVEEKESRLKESMKLMGLHSGIYWLSWFVKYFLITMLVVNAFTAICHSKLTGSPMMSFTATSVTLVFILLYAISAVAFTFAVLTFFSKASTASTVNSIVYFLTYLPHMFLDKNMRFDLKMFAMLDFNLAVMYGWDTIMLHEGMGVRLNWSDIAQPISRDSRLALVHVFLMLIFDTILYSLVTWYVDAVYPGSYGTARPFYFPFMKSYWCSNTGHRSSQQEGDREENDVLSRNDSGDFYGFEDAAADAKVGIRIRHLTKVFKKTGKVAVNNLNVDIYEGNITAVIGQNGAGKTTTISMLTGLLSPSEGSVHINGLNIKDNMDTIRESLGLCPQHDILFKLMTVKEHLIFFAKLKGCPASRVELEVSKMISALHMTTMENTLAKNLSGGYKRKLCVGIALIGDSSFVILDEPTSGMDPEARRQTWDILQSLQRERTIILSTHYMDEADILGDRIAIMADGQIKCYGTSMFLKNKFGVGYHMTVVKGPDCDVDGVVELVKMRIPDSKLKSNVGTELSFVLPREQSHLFEEMFSQLEERQKALDVESFGVSVTTMEDVFLRFGNDMESTLYKEQSSSPSAAASDRLITGDNTVFGVNYRTAAGVVQNAMQVKAMIYKRLIHSLRNKAVAFTQLFSPFFFTLLACLNSIIITDVSILPALRLDLTHFTDPVTPYEVLKMAGTENVTSGLSNCYSQVTGVGGNPVLLNDENDFSTMDNFLINVARNNLGDYNLRYVIGATISAEPGPDSIVRFVGWFNNEAFHSAAISLSYVTNALLKCVSQSDYRIETFNHPLPWKREKKERSRDEDVDVGSFVFTFFLCAGLGQLVGTFAMFLVKERVSGIKHLQIVSSVKKLNFWIGAFVWDMLNYLVPVLFILVLMASFQVRAFSDSVVIWFLLLDFFFFGFSIIPLTYALSFIFQKPSTAHSVISFLIFVTSFVTTIIMIVVSAIYPMRTSSVGRIIELVFHMLLPNFCFDQGVRNLYTNFMDRRKCAAVFEDTDRKGFCLVVRLMNSMHPCCPDTCGSFCYGSTSYVAWETPGIGKSLVFMALQFFVFCFILYLIEINVISSLYSTLRRSFCKTRDQNVEDGTSLIDSQDSDVLIERDRVANDQAVEDSIVMKELEKKFGSFTAVNRVSVGIPSGECFGLLGVNGAGKTSCFKMLTGDLTPTSGNAYINRHCVATASENALRSVGYCPQLDAIVDQMTVKETLAMFACIRGIETNKRDEVVRAMIERLMLTEEAHKQNSTLSGGNKRKLSVAIALIGEPSIVFLDEPTTGMDPSTKRTIWNVLAAVRDSGRTLVLTSHGMEECEALCTRLTIMVNGSFQCLGSIQHLKAKFAKGYTLIVKIPGRAEETSDVVDKVKTFVRNTFPGSVLRECREGLLTYQVDAEVLVWSRVFGAIERARHELQIEDYSVSQTSLEQLFLSFARMQRTSKIPEKPKKSFKSRIKSTFV